MMLFVLPAEIGTKSTANKLTTSISMLLLWRRTTLWSHVHVPRSHTLVESVRSVSGWLLNTCQTEGLHTLGEMVSHTYRGFFSPRYPHILLIMVCHTEGPCTVGKMVNHTGAGCPNFHKEKRFPYSWKMHGYYGDLGRPVRGSQFPHDTGF